MKASLLLLTICLFGTQSFAQEDIALTEQSPETEVALNETAPQEKKIALKIEEKFGLSQGEIAKYREAKLGYGQIMLMAEFSKKSGKNTEEMIALLNEKKSVRQVANELNINKEDMAKFRADMKGMRGEVKEMRHEKRMAKNQERHQERRQERRQERKEERREARHEGRNEERKAQGRHR